MQLSYLIKALKSYVNSLLDREGWGIAFELKEKELNRITLHLKDRVVKDFGIKNIATAFDIPTFAEIFDNQLGVAKEIADEREFRHIDPYHLYTYKQKLLTDLEQIFGKNPVLIDIYNQVQKNNYSYIDSFEVKNFFSIEHIRFKDIHGAREVYLLGENGDGKSLVLMAMHLAFNGNHIQKNSNFEYTGKIRDIFKANKSVVLNAKDANGTVYGKEKIYYINNVFCYGVHRGRFSSDNFEQYGFMSLYDSELQLYSPEQLLTQTFLLELEKRLDISNAISEEKVLPNWVPLEKIQRLFQALLENNVTIDVSARGVKFKEKGFDLIFNQLSEGYKNIMVWVSDMIYRFQLNQPNSKDFDDFKGIVLLDEVELHLHPIWQRRLISQLRYFFSNIQFIFTTHSPTIIQGAAENAIIYKIYRNPVTGKTCSSEAYFKKDLDHLMLNTLATSPLFGLDNARVSQLTESADTSDTYLQSRVSSRIEMKLEQQKAEGKEFLSDDEIDSLIDSIIQEEIGQRGDKD